MKMKICKIGEEIYYSSEEQNYTVNIDNEYFNLRFTQLHCPHRELQKGDTHRSQRLCGF